MYVEVISTSIINDHPLFPAPGVRDMEHLSNVSLTSKSLQSGPLEVIMNYRGVLLYLENGAQVYRSSPSSESNNGFTGTPVTDEDVFISYLDVMYNARVKFS